MSRSDPRATKTFFLPKRTAQDSHVNQESQHLLRQEAQLQLAQTTALAGSETAHLGPASAGDTTVASARAGDTTVASASAGDTTVASARGGSTLVEIERIWRIRKKGVDLPDLGNLDRKWEFINFAEDYWTKKAKVSAGRLDAYRTNLASSTNQLIQLIGLYIVFQGVLLTACVQSARLTCKTYWFPFALNIIATLCAISGVLFKFKEIIGFEDLEDEFNQEHKT